ncbi:MAG: ABC-2 family transporter protein, partial [Elusimicrobia bacterium]|nr:ABC-2 family transporter protein [Elusimicrobiota bacterium]
MKKYLVVWWKLAQMAFLMQFANRWSSLGWLGGKIVRFVFFLVFITAIFKHISTVAGYNLQEVALFFLTFNVVDIIAQLFFRGLYMVGRDIREGDMDFYLIQPINPLFRISSNLIDFLDFL